MRSRKIWKYEYLFCQRIRCHRTRSNAYEDNCWKRIKNFSWVVTIHNWFVGTFYRKWWRDDERQSASSPMIQLRQTEMLFGKRFISGAMIKPQCHSSTLTFKWNRHRSHRDRLWHTDAVNSNSWFDQSDRVLICRRATQCIIQLCVSEFEFVHISACRVFVDFDLVLLRNCRLLTFDSLPFAGRVLSAVCICILYLRYTATAR